MSGSKKRGKGERRATQLSVKRDSEKKVEKEDELPVCSCGSSGFNGETIWKEDSVEDKEEVSAKDEKDEKSQNIENVVAAAPKEEEIMEDIKKEDLVAAKEAEIVEDIKKEDLTAEKEEESGTEEEKISRKNSFEETVEAEDASLLKTTNEYESMKDRLNSTSFSEENYRTPLLSPDLWPHEDSDEVHEAPQKVEFDESPNEEPEEKVNDWYRAEKPSEADWSGSPDRDLFVDEMERRVIEENTNVEYPETVEEPKHPSIVHPESSRYYDRLTADMLMSLIESHRDALNDQKIYLARQTDAISRLAAAVEQQTKIISTLNEGKLPIHD